MPTAITPDGTYPAPAPAPAPAPPPPPKRGTVAHLIARLRAPADTWERGYRIEDSAPAWVHIDVSYATADAVAQDLIAYYDANQGDKDDAVPAACLVSDWIAETILPCPLDSAAALDGYVYSVGICEDFSWRASEREDGYVYLDFRPPTEDVESWLSDIRNDDDDLRGTRCPHCGTVRDDIDIDECLSPDEQDPHCPTCGAVWQEGTGYMLVEVHCPHCGYRCHYVTAAPDAITGTWQCPNCEASAPSWAADLWHEWSAPDLLHWTARPHEYR